MSGEAFPFDWQEADEPTVSRPTMSYAVGALLLLLGLGLVLFFVIAGSGPERDQGTSTSTATPMQVEISLKVQPTTVTTTMSGQITKDSAFGAELYRLAKDHELRTFCDVGTWKGYGSTRCLVEGCLARQSQDGIRIYSIEANQAFFDEATALWSPHKLPFLQLLYGKLHDNGMMTEAEIRAHPMFASIQSHFDLWYHQDVKDYDSSPNVAARLPKDIDLVLIDGGEFCGYADWRVLRRLRPKVVCLDDINVIKTNRIHKELLGQPDVWRLAKLGSDRNGWSIFTRIATVPSPTTRSSSSWRRVRLRKSRNAYRC